MVQKHTIFDILLKYAMEYPFNKMCGKKMMK